MRTKEQWVEGLRKMRRNIYVAGQKVDRDDEMMIPTINLMGLTFDYAHIPGYQDLTTATSHISGEKINRFCHIHQSIEDLHKKQDVTRLLTQKNGHCIMRCMGTDAMNAISCVSYEAGKVSFHVKLR